jgi:hypothetical protein
VSDGDSKSGGSADTPRRKAKGAPPPLPEGFVPLDRSSGRRTNDLDERATEELLGGDDQTDKQSGR